MQLWTMIHKTESLRHKDSQLFRGKIVCLQLQQSSAVAQHSTAAAVRQHMTLTHMQPDITSNNVLTKFVQFSRIVVKMVTHTFQCLQAFDQQNLLFFWERMFHYNYLSKKKVSTAYRPPVRPINIQSPALPNSVAIIMFSANTIYIQMKGQVRYQTSKVLLHNFLRQSHYNF